ncbi:MAG: flavodoxin family protein [Candidatus Jordarchaeum sp.]|uniref:flavodoxin family protein n=1 Tax=Candidatus Jordarchaeum sp. TaxID=2823881 RepID=UPI00404AEA46
MKILLAYYSKTGNTEKIAKKIQKTLEPLGKVDLFKIEMVKEYSSKLMHLNPRINFDCIFRRKPEIKATKSTGNYDALIIGSPIWAFTYAPPVNTFIEKLEKAEGKKAVVFVSSGMGRVKFTKGIEEKLAKKGMKIVKSISAKLEQIDEKTLNEISKALKS